MFMENLKLMEVNKTMFKLNLMKILEQQTGELFALKTQLKIQKLILLISEQLTLQF